MGCRRKGCFGAVNIVGINRKDEFPLPPFLIEVDPQDLILGKGYLVQGVANLGFLLWGAGHSPITALREDIPLYSRSIR